MCVLGSIFRAFMDRFGTLDRLLAPPGAHKRSLEGTDVNFDDFLMDFGVLDGTQFRYVSVNSVHLG